MNAALTAVATGAGYAASLISIPFVLSIVAIRRILGFPPRITPLVRFVAAALPATFGILVRVRGLHHVPTDRPLIIITNHVNIFDGFILQGHLPVDMRGLELDSHFSWPVYGTAMRLSGNIPIPHRAPRTALVGLGRAERALSRGISILAFPEGHRTRDGEIHRFMTGPFRVARSSAQAGIPVTILPVVQTGAYGRKRVGSPRVTPGRVDLRIGIPIRTDAVAAATARELRDRVYHEMTELSRLPQR